LSVAAILLAAGNGRAEPAEVASIGTADAAFAWRSDAPEPTRVRVRPADGEEEWRVFETDGGPVRHHVLEVDGLAPGTRYEYRLGEGEDGPRGALTTRDPPPGDPVGVLWVLADLHLCAPEVQECPDGVRRLSAANRIYAAALAEVRERAAALPAALPQAIVVLGDFAQRPVPETWRRLRQSDTGSLPLCLVPGNHEGWDRNWAERFAETVAARRRADEGEPVREAELRQAASGVTIDEGVGQISALGLQISKALAGVSNQLVAELERLAALREAVALEQRELERLHKIDVATTAVDLLVQHYKLKRQAFQAEVVAAKAQWEAESEARDRANREYDESLKRQRQRENDEFEYKKALERKKAQDKYDEEQRLRDRQNRERQEALEKSWQEREAALKAREDELAQLRKEADQSPK
jgi:hypothetical protein